MSSLIILGNTNMHTFANTIVVANLHAQSDLQEPLSKIFVIHTTASQSALHASEVWKSHLQREGVGAGIVETVVELDTTDAKIKEFVDFLTLAVRSAADSSRVIVDLTNGTIQYKNLLSTAAYVLDIQHQYMFDTARLRQLTGGKDAFFPAKTLRDYYIPTPRSDQLDTIAYLNLTEVVRYKKVVGMLSTEYGSVGAGSADTTFFYDNTLHAMHFKLEGDRRKDNALYRIAASSMAASLEEIVASLHGCLPSDKQSNKKEKATFGNQLECITKFIEAAAPVDFDLNFHKKFCEFVLFLRNSTTHKGKLLTVAQRYKSELATKIAFPFAEYCIRELWPVIAGNGQSASTLAYHEIQDPDPADLFYFGVDGDNTGVILERLFQGDDSRDDLFMQMSTVIEQAIDAIVRTITSYCPEAVIIFAAGDDILFKSRYDSELLQAIRQQYSTITEPLTRDLSSLGLSTPTCSIGYGRSFREVYLALKLAKSKPGKNSIVGIEAVQASTLA